MIRLIIISISAFTFTLNPVIDSAVSLNAFGRMSEDLNSQYIETENNIREQCNQLETEEEQDECLSEDGTDFGEVGLGEGEDYGNVGQITEGLGDYLEDEVFMIFITCLIGVVANAIFMTLGGWKMPSSYFVIISGMWYVVTYFTMMGDKNRVLEENLKEMEGTAAASLKFQFTGDQSVDAKTYDLLKTQSKNLYEASEMLADFDNAIDMSLTFMWLATLSATVEAIVCAALTKTGGGGTCVSGLRSRGSSK